MQLLTGLRRLWARRVLIGIGVLLAAAAGLLAARALSSPRPPTWSASARVLVDSSESQLVAAAPNASDTMPLRAELAADLVAADRLKAVVARTAGVPAAQLDILGPARRAQPAVETPLVTKGFPPSTASRAPNAVSLYADGLSSIVAIRADAPERATAAALLAATVGALRSSLEPPRSSREPPRVRRATGIVVDTLGAPRMAAVHGGSRRLPFAAAAAFAVFALSCAAIALAPRVGRRRSGAQFVG